MDSTQADLVKNAVQLQQKGQLKKAVQQYQLILENWPNQESALVNLGIIYFQSNRLNDAFQYLEKAVNVAPQSANSHYNLGYARMKTGETSKAIRSFQNAIELQPSSFKTHLNIGNCYQSIGQLGKAYDHFVEAYKLKKDSLELLNNWALCSINLKRFAQAEKILTKAEQLFPGKWEIQANWGMLNKEVWKLPQAEKRFLKAIELGGDNWQVYHSMAAVYHNWNHKEKALSALNKAMSLNGNSHKLHSDYVYHLNYYPEISNADIFQEHRNWAKKFALGTNTFPQVTTKANQPLRVGLLSGDFCYHPVAIFLLGWLDKVDAKKIQFYGYAEIRNRDNYTREVRKACVQWVETNNISDKELAAKVREDQIDVLIDLAGHTKGNRLPVLSYKPAKIQISYLGYINTTGLSQIDYRLVDEYVNPLEFQQYYSEKLLYLPKSYTCYRPVDSSIPVSELPAIKNGHITFGSFNNPTKINTEVARLWSKILNSIPGSKLLLKARHFSDLDGRKPIIDLFEANGLKQDRLEFEGPSAINDYLKSYQRVDIALDTFPHNGGTTSHDALFMGVPVVGVKGNNYVGRMGWSIMNNLGYPEWIVENEDELVSLSIELSQDILKLKGIRDGLRQKFLDSPLCDGKNFAKDLEILLTSLV